MRNLPVIFLLLVISVSTLMAENPSAGKVVPGAVSSAVRSSLEFNEKGVAAMQSGDLQRAQDMFSRAVSADSGNVTAAFNLAGAYLALKREKDAITLLEKYSAANPADAGLVVRLGDAYFATKDLKKALASYEKAYLAAPKYERLSAKLGTVYTLFNRIEDAERVLLVAVEQDPNDGQLLSNLSSVFLGGGKIERAISTAKRALQVQPTSEVYITLGNAYELQKDYKNSLISFERARDLGSKRPELSAKIAELQKMGS